MYVWIYVYIFYIEITFREFTIGFVYDQLRLSIITIIL